MNSELRRHIACPEHLLKERARSEFPKEAGIRVEPLINRAYISSFAEVAGRVGQKANPTY